MRRRPSCAAHQRRESSRFPGRRECLIAELISEFQCPSSTFLLAVGAAFRGSAFLLPGAEFAGLRFAGLQCLEERIQALELGSPELAIAFQPLVGFGQRLGLKPARTALRVAAARNQAGALE